MRAAQIESPEAPGASGGLDSPPNPLGRNFDFTQSGKGYGAAIQDVLPVLSEQFNIQSQPITTDEIPKALQHGPVMAAVVDGSGPHGELIIGTDKDGTGNDIAGSYQVYNPLNPVASAQILDASQIIRDYKGRPVLYALRPYRLAEKHRYR